MGAGLIGLLLAGTSPLAPAGKWVVNYADQTCILSRDFGPGQSPVQLAMRAWPLNKDLELVVVRQQDRRHAPKGGQASITVSPPNQTRLHRALEWSADDGKRYMLVDADRDELDSLGDTGELAIRDMNAAVTRFELAGVGAALKALDACRDDLAESWGVTAQERAAVATDAAVADFRSGPSDDYPAAALRARESGTTTILFKIGADGRIDDCGVVASSGSASLDDASCPSMTRRVRFRPAVDKEGKPIASHVVQRVRWVLP